MSVQANMTCFNRLWHASISAARTTQAKMLVDTAAGGLTLPDNGSFPTSMPQVTRGGQRIIGGACSSTDSVARDALFFRGSVLTTQSNAATGLLQNATTSSISRATGSFKLDGWEVGDGLMIFGPGPSALAGNGTPDFSNNAGVLTALSSVGVYSILTAVTDLTLTVNGTPLTAEILYGCRLCKVVQVHRDTIAINAGNASATPSQILLGSSNEPDIGNLLAADRGLSLGPSDILAVAAQATISVLPAQLMFTASSVLF